MSILNVVKLSHGFGDRAIFHDVSFRLLKGEHIGLVGANGEGKSRRILPPSEGGARWLCWGKWRREIHIYEYYHRKADA